MNKHKERSPMRRHFLSAVAVTVIMLGVLASVATAPTSASSAAQSSCSAPAWSISQGYNTGAIVSHNGHEWRANWPSWGAEPGTGFPPWYVPWADLGPCAAPTTSSSTSTSVPGSTTTTQPGSTTTTTAPPSGCTGKVEDCYRPNGPNAVSTAQVTVGSDGNVGVTYPTNLGANGYKHPVIVWNSGSGNTPYTAYQDTFNHLASWGYVVAARNGDPLFCSCPDTDDQIRGIADYMVARNGDSGSVFHDNLATDKVAVAGHSSGAYTSGLAMGTSLNSDGLLKTTVFFNLPDGAVPPWDLSRPTLFFTGSGDFVSTAGGNTTQYNAATGPAAKAVAIGYGHGAGLGGTSIDTPDNKYQPYFVAWLKYILENDQYARQAYVGSPAELAADTADFSNWASKNLP